MRPSADKVAKIRDYPTPENEKELEHFLYMTLYLKRYIPGRAEHAKIMKTAVQWEKEGSCQKGKRSTKRKVGWDWTQGHQSSFEFVKKSIVENACVGGDSGVQFYLSCDASQAGIGAVVFQLPSEVAGTLLKMSNHKDMKIVMFISQKLSEAESNYQNTEREALAVLRGLEEARWLLVGSEFPVMVYTDHVALLSVLKGDGTKAAGHHRGRISSWMMRMVEYNVEYHHVKGGENVLADVLSRMKPLFMDPPRPELSDWENVAMVRTVTPEEDEEE